MTKINLDNRERAILGRLVQECEAAVKIASDLIRHGRVDDAETLEPLTKTLGSRLGSIVATIQVAENAEIFRNVDLTDGMQKARGSLARFIKAPSWQEPP